MSKHLVLGLAVAAIGLSAAPARADHGEALVVGVGIGTPISTLGFTAVDLVAAPHAKLYGGVELAVSSTLAVGTVVLWKELRDMRPMDGSLDPIFGVYLACNVALAIHGGYLLAHDDAPRPPLEFSTHGVRGAVAMTPIATPAGNVAAGLGVGGSF